MKPETFFRKTRLKERLEEECESFLLPIWDRYQKEILKFRKIYGFEKYSVYEKSVEIEYWAYDSQEWVGIPIEFVIDFDNALENHNRKIEEERVKIQKEEQEKERLQQEEFEKFERQQYEILKKKYG